MSTDVDVVKKSPHKWFAPRFSLRMLMLMVTAAAVGVGFWWRWPVTTVSTERYGDMVLQETYTCHRGFGGELIKHGLHLKTVNGEVALEEYYREGVLHGPHRLTGFLGDISGEYFAGKKHGTWSCAPDMAAFMGKATENPFTVVWPAPERYRAEEHWNQGRRDGLFQWWDQTEKLCFRYEFKDDRLVVPQGTYSSLLLRRIAAEELMDTKLQHALVERCDLVYRDWPLLSVLKDIEEKHGVRIAFRSRRIAVPSQLLSDDAASIYLFLRREYPFTEQWLKAVPTLREEYLLCNAPIRVDFRNGPLHAGLDAMLAPLGLVLDYRSGTLCVVDVDAPYDWEAATGVPQLDPPAASPLAARLDQPAKPIPNCTLRRALGNLAVIQQIPVELRFEKEDLAAREYLDGWLNLPAGSFSTLEEKAAAMKSPDESLAAQPLTLRQLLCLILDQSNLHCHEENGVLIIEPLQKAVATKAETQMP